MSDKTRDKTSETTEPAGYGEPRLPSRAEALAFVKGEASLGATFWVGQIVLPLVGGLAATLLAALWVAFMGSTPATPIYLVYAVISAAWFILMLHALYRALRRDGIAGGWGIAGFVIALINTGVSILLVLALLES